MKYEIYYQRETEGWFETYSVLVRDLNVVLFYIIWFRGSVGDMVLKRLTDNTKVAGYILPENSYKDIPERLRIYIESSFFELDCLKYVGGDV